MHFSTYYYLQHILQSTILILYSDVRYTERKCVFMHECLQLKYALCLGQRNNLLSMVNNGWISYCYRSTLCYSAVIAVFVCLSVKECRTTAVYLHCRQMNKMIDQLTDWLVEIGLRWVVCTGGSGSAHADDDILRRMTVGRAVGPCERPQQPLMINGDITAI